MITVEQVSQLETGAVSAAEETLQTEDDERRRLFLVGYTVTQYRLDHYPMVTLLDHSGVEVEADVVATFLPGEVVERPVCRDAHGGASGFQHDAGAHWRR